VALTEERRRNEEAIKLLADAWWQAPAGAEPFSFGLVRSLADRNHATCDSYGVDRLRDENGVNLARSLSPQDLIAGVACLQGRSYDDVAKTYGNDVMPNNLKNLAPLYCSKDWNAMLAAIAEADKDKDMGFFDADYWVMGQDYQDISADNIKVERQTEQEATAMLDLHNCGNVIQVRLSLVLEDGQWMIDNFEDVSNGLDWKQAMKEYLEEQ
jgi:hypothetical protein